MYVLMTTVKYDVEHTVSTSLELCEEVFSTLEDAKKAAEEHFMGYKTAFVWIDNWQEAYDIHWWRCGQLTGRYRDLVVDPTPIATVTMDIYKVKMAEPGNDDFGRKFHPVGSELFIG